MLNRYRSTTWLAIATILIALPFLALRLRGETAAEKGQAAYAEHAKRPKVDPIEANGRIFEGWQKPDVALVFSGEQNGYLEPCGCAGLENQKGGLKRRFTFIKQL